MLYYIEIIGTDELDRPTVMMYTRRANDYCEAIAKTSSDVNLLSYEGHIKNSCVSISKQPTMPSYCYGEITGKGRNFKGTIRSLHGDHNCENEYHFAYRRAEGYYWEGKYEVTDWKYHDKKPWYETYNAEGA